MNRYTIALGLGLALVPALAAPAAAQDGFALKFGPTFNSSSVSGVSSDLRLSDAAGWNAGVEYLLPMGVAVGLSGYTAGSPRTFDLDDSSLHFLADANIFLPITVLPLTGYFGVNVGLGTHHVGDLAEVRPEVDFGDRGYQLGVRFQPLRSLGLDAQYRRVSGSLSGEQSSAFERDQFVVSVIVF